MPDSAVLGPRVDASGVTFSVPDPGRDLAGVWLVQEVVHPRTGPEFRRTEHPAAGPRQTSGTEDGAAGPGQPSGPQDGAGPDGDASAEGDASARGGSPDADADVVGWEVRLPKPPVQRMEYLLELLHPDGRAELVLDWTNPRTAPGAFGPKSVVEFDGYRPPYWVEGEATGPAEPTSRGESRELAFTDDDLGGPMRVRLWASPGSSVEDRLPLLVANDGIEYDEFSGLTAMLDRLTADGTLPPMRAALLHPVARDEHYAASPVYARVLTERLLPFLHAHAPIAPGRAMRVGLGASLGGLAMLHAHREYPSAFGGLYLQSASLFHHRYDRFEIAWEHFRRIRQFMDRVHADRSWRAPIPVGMTCGRVEMNYANNRAASLVLRRQGYDVDFHPVPDAHNWVAWRDAWEPGLIALLRRLWS